MPDSEEKKNFKQRMEEIKETAKDQDLGENPTSMLAAPGDFPDLNNMNTPEITKYKEELEEFLKSGQKTMTNLASLWLDGDENVLKNEYIKNRIERDAKNIGHLDFLSSVAQQVLLKQLGLMEQGDQSPRHFEIIYKGMGELEKINKTAGNSMANMENFYRRLRFDLGFEDMPKFGRENKKLEKEAKSSGFNGSMKDLNKLLEERAQKMADDANSKKFVPKQEAPKDNSDYDDEDDDE